MLAVACIFRNNFHNTPYPHLVHAVDLFTPLFEPLILLLQINLNMRGATQMETSGLSISEVQSQLLARWSLFKNYKSFWMSLSCKARAKVRKSLAWDTC